MDWWCTGDWFAFAFVTLVTGGALLLGCLFFFFFFSGLEIPFFLLFIICVSCRKLGVLLLLGQLDLQLKPALNLFILLFIYLFIFACVCFGVQFGLNFCCWANFFFLISI